MENLISTLQGIGIVIAGLSLLVLIHELGHYIPAKLFGMRVEKFYLFFDWPRKLFSFNYKGTEYGVGLIPLGGYVKIAGMIDESLDTDQVKRPPENWEFRAKPVWQRMIVMVGGVTMNVILAVLIFTIAKQMNGESRTPLAELKNGIYVSPETSGHEIGLRTGDVILSFNGQKPEYVEDIASPSIFIEHGAWFLVERDGKQVRVDIPNDYIGKLAESEKRGLPVFFPRYRSVIRKAETGIAAEFVNDKGQRIQDFDRIIAVDSTPVAYYDELKDALKERAGQSVLLAVERGGDTLMFQPTLGKDAVLGVYMGDSLTQVRTQYGFGEAIWPATAMAFRIVGDNLKGFRKLFSGDIDASKGVDGPVGIGKHYFRTVESSGWFGFWMLTAMLSMWLAFINILPIPALDGGHLLLLLVEAVKRRPLSTMLTIRIQQAGMLILLGLMAFVLFNDIFKLFRA